MSDYFNNIFDLIPKKTPKSGSIGDVVPKKKKQKSGGVTGMSNDVFLSPENVSQDVFELPPSESTSTQGPLLSTAQEKAMSAQRWDNKTQEEKRIIKTQAIAKNTVKHAPITLKDSERVQKEWEARGKPYTWSLQQKIDKVEADEAEIAEYGRKAQLSLEDSFRESYGMEKNLTNTILQGALGGLTLPFAAGLEAIKGVTGSDGGADWNRVMPDFYGVSKNPNYKGQSISLSDAVNKDWADKNRNLATLIDVVAPAGVGYKARKAYNLVDKTLDFANSAKGGLGAMPGTFTRSGKVGTKSTYNPYFATNATSPAVPSQPIEPWQMQDLPGLHLKSTMSTNPKGLHKQVNKKGQINVENALKFIKNN